MQPKVFGVLTFLLLMVSLGSGMEVKLSHLSTIYLPHSFNGSTLLYDFPSDALRQAVFEPSGKIIYAVGERLLHIIDASDPQTLTYLNHLTFEQKKLTDVEVCGGAIFVSYVDKNDMLHGGIQQHHLYSKQSGTAALIRDIKIGTEPEMMQATTSCTLVVALENSGVEVSGQLQDPPGGVGIIQFPRGVTNDPDVTTLDFTAFDGMFDELAKTGVRWHYRQNNKFSDDLEPEYVTLNHDETKAYVCLQNNNAIAVVDLNTKNITAIHGLGYKNWAHDELDPSDMDNGIHLATWPVYGLRQPDGIQYIRWKGADYIVTANEGAAKRYHAVNFQDYTRGYNLTDSQISASVNQETREALRNETKLGRLQLSTVDGKDADGKFEKFYSFGSRSFSIFRLSNMSIVFDTQDDLSEKIVEMRSDLFNNYVVGRDARVADGMDKRSDNRGPEPEGVAVGEVQDHLLIFVGIEKPGSVMVYSVEPGNDLHPEFQYLYADGIPKGNRTWGQMYDAKQLHAVYPDHLSFIPADKSGADYPMLLVPATGSDTVSLLKVEIKETTLTTDPSSGTCSTVAGPSVVTLALTLLMILRLV